MGLKFWILVLVLVAAVTGSGQAIGWTVFSVRVLILLQTTFEEVGRITDSIVSEALS